MKKKIIIPIIILLILVATFAGSVAIFAWLQEGQTENGIKVGELTFKYTESKKGNGINLTEAYPMSEEEGKQIEEYFDFKVEGNLSRSDLEYEIEIDTSMSDIPDSGIRVYLTEVVDGNEKEINSVVNLLSSYEASSEGRIIYRETILRNTKNYEKNFRLRLWVDENIDWTSEEYMGHSGVYKVNVKAGSNQSMASTDAVTDLTTSIERVVANDKYIFTESNEVLVDYEARVPYTVNKVDIEVYESNTLATSTITPISDLSGVSSKSSKQNIHTGNNYFKVTTTASNGRTQDEHILKVIKEADPRNDLLNLEVEGYSLTPTFDKDTTEYTLTLEEPTINIIGNKVSEVASIEGLGEKTLVFGENEFIITVTSESGEVKNYTITVTNERPTSPTITGGTGSSWVSTDQTIRLNNPNNAFAISGIDHYEVYDTATNTPPTDSTQATTTTNDTYTVDTNGIHYIYYRTVSNKGLKSVWSSSQVVLMDKSAPSVPTITASDGKASNTWHSADYTLTATSTKNGDSNITYYYGTTTNPTIEGNTITASDNTSGTTYYAKACNEAGICSENATYISKIDKNVPTGVTITASDSKASNTWHGADYTLTVSATKNGGSNLIYYYGTNTNPSTSGSSISVSSNTTGTTYYAKACNEAGVCSDNGSYIAKLDKTAPSTPVFAASDSKASNTWHTANYTLTVSATKNGVSNISYYYGTSSNPITAGNSMSVSSETAGTTYYAKACNEAGVCSGNGSYIAKLDKGPNAGTMQKHPSTANTITATFAAASSTSGIKTTNCYYGTSSNPTTAGTVSGNNCVFNGLSANTTYYYKRCVTNNAGTTACSGVTSKLTAGQVYSYSYTGGIQSLTTPYEGTYKLEVWGAQGATYSSSYPGGYGGYSVGSQAFSKSKKIYIVVGGAGSEFTGGYNGGGSRDENSYGWYGGAGGGATHMATATGTLSSLTSNKGAILIVAGGGGGTAGNKNEHNYSGGHGGGYIGGSSTRSSMGGTQTAAGSNYSGSTSRVGSFGQGASCGNEGPGGGGYYGGGSGNDPNVAYGGGGGSGYIGNSSLTNKQMYCYNCSTSSATATKTLSGTCVSSTATANCAKTGHGYARITITQIN